MNFGASYKITDRITASASVNASVIDGLGRYGTGYDDRNPMSSMRQWWQMNVDILITGHTHT